MMGRRLTSLLKKNRAVAAVGEGEGQSVGRKIVSGALICLTGGVALSAIDDLLIYYGCTSKAMQRASKNQAIIEAIGEPIVRGPWYNASLAVGHKRQSVSCSFPASGPQGTGMFQLKAVRNGDDSWFSYLRPRDWEILIMEALLHVPSNEKQQQTFRINVSDNLHIPPPPPDCKTCTAACVPQQPSQSVEKNQPIS
ncbi:hypothetical protein CASFOL_006548 [Castilleja foliolosa]|uniref:Uncharacterized protein n=1 Tax=Castilleja foliolosa TaxID=1961234 RepID=A0ABD3E6N6_9LAMI